VGCPVGLTICGGLVARGWQAAIAKRLQLEAAAIQAEAKAKKAAAAAKTKAANARGIVSHFPVVHARVCPVCVVGQDSKRTQDIQPCRSPSPLFVFECCNDRTGIGIKNPPRPLSPSVRLGRGGGGGGGGHALIGMGGIGIL
jgi:hypothetical protein